jgi:signal transduction histidine kinase
VLAASTYTASNAWSSGVFVFGRGQGLIYPVGEDTNTVFDGRENRVSFPRAPLNQGGGLLSTTNPMVAIREYRQMLEQSDLTDEGDCRVRLRLAQAYRQAGQWEEARKTLRQVVESGAGQAIHHAVRDPEDGFYYDIVALKVLAELNEKTGDLQGSEKAELELWRRVLDRYDDMAPFQRQLATVQVETMLEKSRKGGRSPEWAGARLSMWRERKRGRNLSRDLRQRLEQEFSRLASSGQVSDEGWTVVRVGTNEYGVTLAGPPGSLFYAVQINHEQLMAALTQSAAVAGGDAGLTIEVLGARDAVVSPGPLLAERRLASPLDRVTLVAYPADSQAFLANVRLQTRLYGWGGFVLIISGVVGGWLMWREAVREIRAARERSDFAAAVSHDLRTPLSSMRMLAESLYLGRIEDESKRKRFLQTILKESDRLSRLTDRALYFIRFGQGALRYRMTEGDLGGVVKDVVETFATGIEGEVREAGTGQKVDEASRLVGRREEASQESEVGEVPDAEQRWRIDLRISSDLPAVRFDAGAMEQVVFNLLDNAVKYSRDNRLIEVSIGEETSRRHIRVAVKDYGLGIDQKDLKRIFKAYQRGGSSKNAAGLGLGLALCHDVVKAHRGTIEVDSQPGCGSTFTVVLPAV